PRLPPQRHARSHRRRHDDPRHAGRDGADDGPPGRVALAHARRANLRLTDALPRRDGRTHARAAWPRPPRPHHPRRGELMPTLADHPSSSVIKLLNIGESKTGKTGALASLVKAGYTLHILDYDNGLDILQTALRGDNAALARVHFATLRDTI